jgi:hypothetical protein
MLTARTPVRAAMVISAAVLAAVVAACSTSGPSADGRAGAAVSDSRCGVAVGDFIPAARLPGYTPFLVVHGRIPPVQSMPGHPLPFTDRYICGQFRGFLTDLALRGAYRRQDNTRARRLGYTLGKWPLVPLTGQIVSQQAHLVLEIYEGVYQFSSPSESADFLRATSGGRGNVIAGLAKEMEGHPLAVRPARGAVVIEHPLGPDKTADELAIYVGLQIGDFAVTLSFQGGDALDWRDVSQFWTTARSRLATIGKEI